MTSARAQSRLSEIEGAFRSSIPRIRWTAVTTWPARRSETSGTFSRMMASSSSAAGKSMKRWRHRRFSPSVSSRALFDVRTTMGMGPPRRLRQHLGQLRLPDPGRTLDQDGPLHPRGEEHDGGDAAAGDVPAGTEALLDLLGGREH